MTARRKSTARPSVKVTSRNPIGEVVSRKSHSHDGFPHFRTSGPNVGACMCTRECCLGPAGCYCRGGCSGAGHENCLGARRRAAANGSES
jgi:hypothetical protein